MAHDIQIVIDTDNDPHALADWWADALQWTVEPSDEEFIRRMVAAGHATDADTTTHKGVLVWREGAAIRHPEDRRRILFMLVPEAKTTKNRLHLDIRVGQDNLEAEFRRLTDAGATFLHRGRQGPHTWITLADPEGNELCIAG